MSREGGRGGGWQDEEEEQRPLRPSEEKLRE